MADNVGMISLGCPKNQVDSEVMLGLLAESGYKIVNNSQDADIIIVNTCGFIGPAKEESIETILNQIKYKTNGRCRHLIVSGCLAQRYARDLYAEIPEIDAIVGTEHYSDIVNIIRSLEYRHRPIIVDNSPYFMDKTLPRILSTALPTAYLKIAEGCNNHCTYCIIPKIRGKYRSRHIESLVEEAEHLVNNGVKELILVAQDVTAYGKDIDNNGTLVDLLKELCKISELKWIRMLYCYPDYISDELLDLMYSQPKICKYLDIPIQHINSTILRKMNRHFTPNNIKYLLNRIREIMPQAIMRTSLIVGFPGETENDFNELCDFIREFEFNNLGVFSYSPEEGTPAAEYQDQIPDAIKDQRRMELMSIQQKISKKLNRQRIGQVCDVLIEGLDSPGVYFGRSYAEAPGIDGQIFVFSNKPINIGSFVKVKIKKAYEYDLVGEAYEFSK